MCATIKLEYFKAILASVDCDDVSIDVDSRLSSGEQLFFALPHVEGEFLHCTREFS